MTDRDAMLAFIRKNPDADMGRLAYADWLDDHGAGDLDAATAEFVRASCHRPTKTGANPRTMPRTAYTWLEDNWHRLVPSLAPVLKVRTADEARVRGRPAGSFAFARSGRMIHATAVLVATTGRAPLQQAKLRHLALPLDFYRGFLRVAVIYSNALDKVARP